MFTNRIEAGKLLANRLLEYNFDRDNAVVIALPQRGVPVAHMVATTLNCDLDIIGVKKIGLPGNQELAIGAITESGAMYINEPIKRMSGLSEKEFSLLKNSSQNIAQKKSEYFRFGLPLSEIYGKDIIIVDDGIATGATIEACINQLKTSANKIIVATPLAPRDVVKKLSYEVDEVVVLEMPSPFVSVGKWYRDFDQIRDTEVREIFESYKEHFSYTDEFITAKDLTLKARVKKVKNEKAWIVFVHGSGSSRLSKRNNKVAKELNQAGFSTLLFDLLTENEDQQYENRFNIDLLSQRLVLALNWLKNSEFYEASTPIGLFGASTGAAAALKTAANYQFNFPLFTVVSRGGRPDLIEIEELREVSIPVELIIGGLDYEVLEFNKKAHTQLAKSNINLISGASHLFEEKGAMDAVCEIVIEKFQEHLESYPVKAIHPSSFKFLGDISKDLH